MNLAPNLLLTRLIAGITDTNMHGEVDFGPAIGRETWAKLDDEEPHLDFGQTHPDCPE